MSQSVNLSWKMAVQNACFAFAYFCGGHKIVFGYNFVAPLKPFLEEPFLEVYWFYCGFTKISIIILSSSCEIKLKFL